MKKRKNSSAITMLLLAILLTSISIYINRKNNELSNAQNESKSQLTNPIEQAKKMGLKELIKNNLKKQTESADNQKSADDTLTLERNYTEVEINEMSEEQFINLLKDTERRLPKLSDIKKLPPGVLHRTPPIVIQAGRDLGVIKEILKVHESYERVAKPFYSNCAKNKEGSTPVRALCLTNLIEIKKKNNEKLSLEEFPKQLIELSKMITDI